jgi:hypothetical protein
MRALECGYEVILTAMSADEIISNKGNNYLDSPIAICWGQSAADESKLLSSSKP